MRRLRDEGSETPNSCEYSEKLKALAVGEINGHLEQNEKIIEFLLNRPDARTYSQSWNDRYLLPGGCSELERRLRLREVYEAEIARIEGFG
jgi:hypothetical protein